VKTFLLFDNDGVLVDTEHWYYKAGERALADIGIRLDLDQYLHDMAAGLGTWHQAALAGVDETTIDRLKGIRNDYYQHYLSTEPIAIDGVVEVLATLSQHLRMAIVTTSKRTDFDLIHAGRGITDFMDFVLTREDYVHSKPHPEPYLTALERFGATKTETLIVEDSARGLRSAVAAGIDCAVVHNAFTQSQDFSRATYRINTLSDLIPLIGAE
jgi:HAD superfamily hydrolase (TIGR01509 family)